MLLVSCFWNVSAQYNLSKRLGVQVNEMGIGIHSNFELTHNLELDANIYNLKHSKEAKVQNPSFVNPRPYIFGKKYDAVALDLVVGKVVKLSEAKNSAPQLSISTQIGPSIAFLKPYYVYVQEADNPQFSPVLTPQTSEVIDNQDYILGSADRFKGIDELESEFGVAANIKFSAEWTDHNRTQGINLGIRANHYFSDLDILHQNDNRNFRGLFVGYFRGI